MQGVEPPTRSPEAGAAGRGVQGSGSGATRPGGSGPITRAGEPGLQAEAGTGVAESLSRGMTCSAVHLRQSFRPLRGVLQERDGDDAPRGGGRIKEGKQSWPPSLRLEGRLNPRANFLPPLLLLAIDASETSGHVHPKQTNKQTKAVDELEQQWGRGRKCGFWSLTSYMTLGSPSPSLDSGW